MALVHIFIPTYRRATHLKRALTSVRAQTVTDWIAVVHNDSPDDPGPASLLAELNDPRIHLVTHERNLGPVAAFNRGVETVRPMELYFAILEDDNTWDPTFLETLQACLERDPSAAMVWCNQRIWIEDDRGNSRDSGHSVHPEPTFGTGSKYRETTTVPNAWGDLRQATGARMANSAMLIRTERVGSLSTPDDIPFTGMEALRERLVPHPTLFLPQVLATYTHTRSTARGGDGHRWGAFQTLLLAAFVRHAGWTPEEVRKFWAHLRSQRPPPTNLALHAALSCEGCGALFRDASLWDWLRYLKTWLGRPRSAWTCLRARVRHPEWWSFVNRCTSARFAEAKQQVLQTPASP